MLDRCQQVIVTIKVLWNGASRSVLQRAVWDGHALLKGFGLCPLVIGDAALGGGLDAQHLLGFGMDLASPNSRG
jgi:hypothetical protein